MEYYPAAGRAARRGGEGSLPHPRNRKNIEKWCYFPELYKMAKVLEDRIENW